MPAGRRGARIAIITSAVVMANPRAADPRVSFAATALAKYGGATTDAITTLL